MDLIIKLESIYTKNQLYNYCKIKKTKKQTYYRIVTKKLGSK